MRIRVAMFILMLVPAVSHSMHELPGWLTHKQFEDAKTELDQLRQTSNFAVQRTTEKLYLKIITGSTVDRNAKYLIQIIATQYRSEPETNRFIRIIPHINLLIGKKFSNLPDDPHNNLGILLWLAQKKRQWPLPKLLKIYLANPKVFAETVAAVHYRKPNNEIFL